ncbi:protease [Actinocatenispora thailandica]|uniref:Protease n=1 Tax=Actinocatenispora thailandica TaxID=227318 RepID=A0A7R7DV16_9ACTN|nr:trypsin-like peptidase domain-containing protein [Actinocatenispora thailandica]BCJ38171.1 protease [Actinocatenispora thailandica]
MFSKRSVLVVVPVLLTAAVLAGCTNGGKKGGSGTPSSTTAAGSDSQSSSYEKVVSNVLRSVVQINTSQGLGSGVVYDDKGDIVTNAHVVGSATSFQVTTATSQKPLSATLVASYPPNDIAVIRVSGDLNVPAAKFGDSGKLKVGQQVLAMGSPLGLSGSVTNGIVSAVGRTVQEPRSQDAPATTISDMVQTSAAINPGNSGGALVDLNSQVVGVPTLAATDQQEGGAAPGIGFALSSNTVTRIADQIIKNGSVGKSGRAALGVTVRPVLNQDYQPAGAAVVSVTKNGPADKAGIRAGDVITAVDGTQVTDVGQLTTILAGHQPGDTVEVTVDRDGNQQQIKVKLGEQ